VKAGDLVKYSPNPDYDDLYLGVVMETGAYVGRKDVKIYWPTLNEVCTEFSKYLEVVSESRSR